MKHLGPIAFPLALMLQSLLGADYQPRTLPLAAAAPDFQLQGVDGKTHSLNEFANSKVLCIVFTCNHCPSAQYYEDRIKQIATDYGPKGVAVVAISPNDPHSVRLDELGWSDMGDTFEEMKLRAQRKQFNFPYLFEGDAKGVSRAYGPQVTPHVFLFDADRKLRYVGAVDDSERIQHVKQHYVRDALDALLAGREPAVTKTKVVGCSVKWAGKAENVKAYMEKLAAEPVTIAPADAETLRALRENKSGKFRLINFWATWCAPCIAEFSEFVTINRMYRHRDFEMISVSLNRPEEEKAVVEFLKKREASFKNYIFGSDDRDKLINAFEPEWEGPVPYTLLIDPDGKVIHRETGSIDPLELRRKIVAAMNEKKPW